MGSFWYDSFRGSLCRPFRKFAAASVADGLRFKTGPEFEVVQVHVVRSLVHTQSVTVVDTPSNNN
jgi:hypothetical protein